MRLPDEATIVSSHLGSLHAIARLVPNAGRGRARAPGVGSAARHAKRGRTRADPPSRGHGNTQWSRGTERGPDAPSGVASGIGSSTGDSLCLTKSPSTARFT
jgi:hypothetical protein